MVMTNEFDRLSDKLKKIQSPARYHHSRSVADLAAELGEIHGWNPERARLAGLLHDWVKEWPPKELVQYVKKNNLTVPKKKLIIKNNPNHLHAYVGADFVRRQGWITNKRSLSAIAHHTFGSAKMSLEEKILYVADLASPDRRFKEAESIRALAKKDLNMGFLAALELKIKDQLRKKRFIHPVAVKMWNQSIVEK